jgi:hypothetical protein
VKMFRSKVWHAFFITTGKTHHCYTLVIVTHLMRPMLLKGGSSCSCLHCGVLAQPFCTYGKGNASDQQSKGRQSTCQINSQQ